ncbi:hypothetical protein ACM16X_04280 [Haloarcula japonica]|uniref:hypothetical protein n=1 Tax=Haloarcula japonica TaxID=29282 RepID=UPI0039F68372
MPVIRRISKFADNDADYLSYIQIFSLPLVCSLLVSMKYISTHEYPALAGGFYIAVGQSILASFPNYPETIPQYTYNGVRAGMPPFGATIAAIITKLTSTTVVTKYLPLIYHTLSALAGTYVAYVHTDDFNIPAKSMAASIGAILALSPSVYYWHITAGGTVRALGYLLFLVGIALSIKVFRDRHRRTVLILGLVTGLAISTHPFYGFMTCIAVFCAFLAYRPSSDGILWGITIAGIATLVAAVWMIPSILENGVRMYLTVSSSKEGLLQWTWSPLSRIYNSGWRGETRPLWIYLGLVSTSISVIKGRKYLLMLLFSVTIFIPRPRFIIVPLILLSGYLLLQDIPNAIDYFMTMDYNISIVRTTTVGVGIILLVSSSIMGGVTTIGTESPTSFVRGGGIEAADWAQENTLTNSTFIVADDFAEWWPIYANRSSLVAPRGAEWDRNERKIELAERRKLHSCTNAQCVASVANSQPVDTDYVVVPTTYIAHSGRYLPQSDRLLISLSKSPRFETVYNNHQYVIYAYNSPA